MGYCCCLCRNDCTGKWSHCWSGIWDRAVDYLCSRNHRVCHMWRLPQWPEWFWTTGYWSLCDHVSSWICEYYDSFDKSSYQMSLILVLQLNLRIPIHICQWYAETHCGELQRRVSSTTFLCTTTGWMVRKRIFKCTDSLQVSKQLIRNLSLYAKKAPPQIVTVWREKANLKPKQSTKFKILFF